MTRKGNQLNKFVKTEVASELWVRFSRICRENRISCSQMIRNLIGDYCDTASSLRIIRKSEVATQVSERNIDTIVVECGTPDTTGEAREVTNSDSTHIVSR